VKPGHTPVVEANEPTTEDPRMDIDTRSTHRHTLLLVVASASVTMALAITVGAVTGYLHPPAASVSADVAAPAAPARTVLVPIRPDGPAPTLEAADVPASRLIAAGRERRHERHERQEDDRRHHEDDDDDD
jgi:hypothetical protein